MLRSVFARAVARPYAKTVSSGTTFLFLFLSRISRSVSIRSPADSVRVAPWRGCEGGGGRNGGGDGRTLSSDAFFDMHGASITATLAA
jgi:hypothetical protein